jgi:anhydro-N-acetylmuramic acid kinase
MIFTQPQHTYHVIGLMSGSSLDGLDIAYCRFILNVGNHWDFDLLASDTVDLGTLINPLRDAFHLSSPQLDLLSKDFGYFMADAVQTFIKKNSINAIDMIASHGHTIFHYPDKGLTCQIGDGQLLANETGYIVVNNLRQRDMDFGGQGAPIVPIGDKHLFSSFKVCVNIGGIANISVQKADQMLAYDICSANQVLNTLALRLGKSYDIDGLLARNGRVNQSLLYALNQLTYYKIDPPKSLDNSFTQDVMEVIDGFDLPTADALASYTEHLAEQIALHIKSTNLSEYSSVLITGGGAHNTFLVERIRAICKSEVVIPSKDIIDYKEAIIMGFIGVLRIRNEVNVLASVTGASKDTSSGEVFYPNS